MPGANNFSKVYYMLCTPSSVYIYSPQLCTGGTSYRHFLSIKSVNGASGSGCVGGRESGDLILMSGRNISHITYIIESVEL